MNATLKQHGIETTNEVSIRYAGRVSWQPQAAWAGWVIECQGMQIASGLKTEAQAKQWAKRRELVIAR